VALENLGDVIETKLAELSEQEIGVQYTRSPETSKLTEGLYIIVHDSLAFTRQVIRDNNMDAARQILDLEPHIKKLRHDLMVRKSERLGSDDGNAILLARILPLKCLQRQGKASTPRSLLQNRLRTDTARYCTGGAYP